MKRIDNASRTAVAGLSPGLARAAACAAMLTMLASCGTLGFGGGSSDDSDSAPAPRSTMGTFFHNFAQGGPDTPPPAAAPAGQTRYPDAVTKQDDFECPILEVTTDGAAIRDPAGQVEGGSQALRHQIAISHVARECRDAGANIAIKLGVEGSVVLGPSGSPGTFTVPLLFEAKLNDKVIASRRETLSVNVPADRGRAFFDAVITDFVIPKNNDVDLFVGLSQGGGGEHLRTPRHKRRHAKR